MTDNSKGKIRKKRKTYNIEGHVYELTFSCYYQYSYIESNPVQIKLVKNPEDWQWSSYRARKYKEGLLPDDFDIPFLRS